MELPVDPTSTAGVRLKCVEVDFARMGPRVGMTDGIFTQWLDGNLHRSMAIPRSSAHHRASPCFVFERVSRLDAARRRGCMDVTVLLFWRDDISAHAGDLDVLRRDLLPGLGIDQGSFMRLVDLSLASMYNNRKRRTCAVCGETRPGLRRCPCRLGVYYCSTECQAEHADHRRECPAVTRASCAAAAPAL